MKKLQILLMLACCVAFSCDLQAADTVFVKETQVPVLLERQDNILFYLRLNANESQTFDEVVMRFSENTNLQDIQNVKLYYSGTEALQDYDKKRFAPVSYLSFVSPGKTLAANPSYSILKSEITNVSKRKLALAGKQKLFPGVNYFWVSLQMKPGTSLTAKVSAEITSVILDKRQAPMKMVSPQGIVHRMGIGVRHAGDDGSAAFRIPGLATSIKGTLLAVYDVRYNSSVDLQEHVDVGLSRSTDGGQTWEKMRLPLAFGETGGLPAGQNGVGDPCILVDTQTNTIWVVAAWTHGMGNKRAWVSSYPGMDKTRTAQLILTKSTDDGKTWSQPINITDQVKDPSWYFLLQGPGRGITMHDGTLVFPIQFIDSTRVPNAGIMYSKDRGETWKLHNLARNNTTEAQVAEVEPGVLMLNMRDNRGGSRAVATTSDLGNTWTEHVSSRKALQEPVCMASLINVKASENCFGKDLLLFSNPNTTKGRHHITIKASLDGGVTWLPQHQVLLDEESCWGYSCLSMIDSETVGILYESSVAQITFQAVRLTDILCK
ncbi:BNR-repeat neuraminidase N-terminal domain-containing protein [Bacteroides cellulosilyticus]|uniref:BNR-repeat neuraminidase N-terminal domain-containing protein n=1 Tax=Bacteroides cellulosilyticus TaxID=246787 RepID=UPI003567A69E